MKLSPHLEEQHCTTAIIPFLEVRLFCEIVHIYSQASIPVFGFWNIQSHAQATASLPPLEGMAVGSLQSPSCLLGSQRGAMHLTDVFCCPRGSVLAQLGHLPFSNGTGCRLSIFTASCCPGPSHVLVCVHVAPWNSFGLFVCFLWIPPILIIQSPLDKV